MSQAGADQEPRRSVRATKGQHTKTLEHLEQTTEQPVKRRGKKSKKQDEKQDDPEEEIIRCVCGATEQAEDEADEPWICCDTCSAWQHNVCVGMSIYSEDLPKHYYCEQCRPDMHKDLLEAMARGEKPWEARREMYEKEKGEKKKRGRGRKGRGGKRVSDSKREDLQNTNGDAVDSTPPPARAAADVKKEKDKKESVPPRHNIGKRKAREDSQDKDAKVPAHKHRKLSEPEAPIVDYTAPSDLAAKISDLPDPRDKTAKLLFKSLKQAIGVAVQNGVYQVPEGTTVEAKAERLALEVERAVHDTHPGHKEYASQSRSLGFNLKSNQELCNRLLRRTLAPTGLAVMTTDEMASKELQRETAEMKARAEKQSILITEEGPRVRRTHKGEEVVEADNFIPNEETPTLIRRPSVREPAPAEVPRQSSVDMDNALHIDTQQSPKQSDFNIQQVFSSVKSPTGPPAAPPVRQASGQLASGSGPGFDPDVDRLLQDDNDSPPYSPTEETDPDVVWRGMLTMAQIAEFPAVMRFAGGANLERTLGLPWTTLLPRRMTVGGRIDQVKAINYLCGLRYSDITDIVVLIATPADGSAASSHGFGALLDYFLSRKKYAVITQANVGNVRDTYLVPVPPGEGNIPEFLLNLEHNVPERRDEPLLLAVYVYRNEKPSASATNQSGAVATAAGGTADGKADGGAGGVPPTPGQAFAHRQSISGPAFSPTSPQGAFSTPTPTPTRTGPSPGLPMPVASASGSAQNQNGVTLTPADQAHLAAAEQERLAAQKAGEGLAKEVLGPLIGYPTVAFLLPHAFQMTRTEWEIIRDIFEKDGRAREDLQHLSSLLEKRV